MRSLRDLTQHLTTRADDNHAPPVTDAPKRNSISRAVIVKSCKVLFALLRIKPCSTACVLRQFLLSFNLAVVLPGGVLYCVSCTEDSSPTPSTHRLRRGLPGYLILLCSHALSLSVVIVQKAAFATGVLPNIYAFHRYTRNSAFLSCTLARQFQMQSARLSLGLSHLAWRAAYAPFTPSNSG